MVSKLSNIVQTTSAVRSHCGGAWDILPLHISIVVKKILRKQWRSPHDVSLTMQGLPERFYLNDAALGQCDPWTKRPRPMYPDSGPHTDGV
jgi:hypothetical protein